MVSKAKADHEASSIFVLGSFVAACCAKVAHLPRPGESLRAQAFTLEAGGKGFNLAVGARRLGAEVDGVLAVGDDFFSQLAGPALINAGLSTDMMRTYPGATGSGIGFTDAAGENCLAVYPGANLLLSRADMRSARERIARARLVLAQFEIGDEPIAEAFRLAREAGALTLLNPSPYRNVLPEILASTSILVLNRVEALHMGSALGLIDAADDIVSAPGAFETLAQRLRPFGPETVIITLGAEGALACRSDATSLHQRAFVIEVIDTLGAGDAFSAGLAVSLAEGRPFAECLQRAVACGALSTRRLGVLQALPDRAELESFLRNFSQAG
jgi:ribokinase